MDRRKIIQELTEEKSGLDMIIHEVEKRLSKAPEGTVRVGKHGKKHQFFLRMQGTDKCGTYIPVAERKKAIELLQKKYDLKVQAAAIKQRKLLEYFLKSYDPEVMKKIYSGLQEIQRENITPVEISDEEFIKQWQEVKYPPKGFDEGVPRHTTSKGERVRSKSEALIAETLRQENIPYRYEYPLHLRNEIVHPDFTILRIADREVIYWEHLGRMDDPGYVKKNIRRLRLFEEHGIFLGINLILTMETEDFPIDISVIKRMIQIYCK